MSIGSNIKRHREASGLTQEKLAEALGLSFQAVSAWERDEYRPELDTFVRLTEVLGVASTAILEDKAANFKTRETLYDWEHMKTFIKTTAKNCGMRETLLAIDFAVEAHDGQKRKNSEVPYIYHPLNMACHALALGIREDEAIAAILLHDVLEDCKDVTSADLPVSSRTIELVQLMTFDKGSGELRKMMLDKYYGSLAGYPTGALIKCIDRCNNLTTMSWGLTRDKIYRMIEETEKYYPTLLRVLKDTPEYNDAAWLLKYQMESMLDIYKRLL